MGVISVRLDNDTETRLKREARAQGVSFSDFLRERLTGGSQEVTEPDLKKIAEVLDGDLRQICDFLEHTQREPLNVKLVVSDFLNFFVLGLILFPDSDKRYPVASSPVWDARSSVLDAPPWLSRRLRAFWRGQLRLRRYAVARVSGTGFRCGGVPHGTT